MATRTDLVDWVGKAVKSNGGKAHLTQVAKYIWEHHQNELMTSKPLAYTWQYDMRWAATKLRKEGKLKPADECERGVWESND